MGLFSTKTKTIEAKIYVAWDEEENYVTSTEPEDALGDLSGEIKRVVAINLTLPIPQDLEAVSKVVEWLRFA
jgi:hypothetical protein